MSVGEVGHRLRDGLAAVKANELDDVAREDLPEHVQMYLEVWGCGSEEVRIYTRICVDMS